MPEAKALFAAVFIHYLVYGFFYVLEGMKYEELIQAGKNENKAGIKQ